jgi:hypothetical protein
MGRWTIRALALIALALSGTAQAQDPEAGDVSVTAEGSAGGASTGARGPMRVYGGLHLGGGGSWVSKVDGNRGETSLGFLIGFQGGLDYVMHQYFALGGEFRLTSTKPSWGFGDPDRMILVDLTAKPRGRYEFASIPLEVYGTLPLGFSIVAPRNNLDTKFNMNFGIGGGATYFFTEKMGINSEMIGIFHWFRQDLPLDLTSRNRLGQFYLFANFVYVL